MTVDPAAVLAAASAALGGRLSDGVDLGGSARTVVLRCRTDAGESVVVKAYRDDPEALACFTAEAAGLAFAGHGPRLLAVDPVAPLIVMTDLGTAPSLADALLGANAAHAGAGLLAWACGYGGLAAATLGRAAELAGLRARYDLRRPGADVSGEAGRAERIAALPGVLAALGVPAPAGLAADLAAIGALAACPYPVFSPGDICPDNNLLTPDGLRVLDFEGAGYHSVFLDAAYARMPFATCWCVFRLPAGLADAVEATYRAQLTAGYPDLADDAVWRPGVRTAMAAWTLDATVALAPRAAAGDRPMHRRRRPVPTVRQLLRYRWESAADALAEPGDLPAFAELARRLLAATAHWGVAPMPHYPAFADSPHATDDDRPPDAGGRSG